MPIGTQTNTDNFLRANETPLAGNWTQILQGVPTFILQTNAVTFSASSNDIYARYNPWTSGDDQYSQIAVTVAGTGAGTGAGPSVRISTGGQITLYRLVTDASGNYVLARRNNDVGTTLASGTLSYVAGTLLGLSITGSTLKIWYGGVQVGSDIVDGSPLASGQPGFGYSSTSTSLTLDDWDAGTTGSPAAVYIPVPHYADRPMSF